MAQIWAESGNQSVETERYTKATARIMQVRPHAIYCMMTAGVMALTVNAMYAMTAMQMIMPIR